jgi:hypothetical protein
MSDALDRFFAGDDEALGEISPAPKPLSKPQPHAGMRVIAGGKDNAAPAFKFTAVSDLEIKAPDFLIVGLIEKGALGLMFGDPGCGKSFSAVDLSMCVASGHDFHGREVEQGSVFYIAGEGHSGLARRFHAWAQHHGVPMDDLPLYKSERAASFLDGASAKAVADAVDEIAAEVGSPKLIIVDTLARNFGAGDENSTQDMNNFILAMDDLKDRYPDSVLLIVHHTGHADKQRARGAMALKGALDFEFRLEKSGTTLTLTNTKMKDAEPPEDMHFEFHGVKLGVDDHGEPFGSAVLVDGEAPEKSGEKLSKAQSRGLRTFRAAADKYGAIHDEGNGVRREDWKEMFRADYEGEPSGVNSAFSQAISSLKGGGYINQNNNLFQLTHKGGAGE